MMISALSSVSWTVRQHNEGFSSVFQSSSCYLQPSLDFILVDRHSWLSLHCKMSEYMKNEFSWLKNEKWETTASVVRYEYSWNPHFKTISLRPKAGTIILCQCGFISNARCLTDWKFHLKRNIPTKVNVFPVFVSKTTGHFPQYFRNLNINVSQINIFDHFNFLSEARWCLKCQQKQCFVIDN